MPAWTGTLFVLHDAAGRHHVSLGLPKGRVSGDVTLYAGTGPRAPLAGGTVVVEDVAAWLAERGREGFRFEREAG